MIGRGVLAVCAVILAASASAGVETPHCVSHLQSSTNESLDAQLRAWREPAAPFGPRAEFERIAVCLMEARYVGNMEEAAEWTRKRAEEGSAEAELYFGTYLVLVSENPIDHKVGFKVLKPLALSGSARAQFALVVAGWLGRGPRTENSTIIQWLEASAEAGYFPAQESLACALRAGRNSVRKDEVRAQEWARRTAASATALGAKVRSCAR